MILFHPHALERSPLLCHLVHEATGLIVYFCPALVARGEYLRALANFSCAAVSFRSVLRHGAIISLASRLPDTYEFKLVEKSEYIEREVVPDGSAYKKLEADANRDRCEYGQAPREKETGYHCECI